jgi:transmembrane sensor
MKLWPLDMVGRGRRARVEDAARWALRRADDGRAAVGADEPWIGDPARLALYRDVAATLSDPALNEALAACARSEQRLAQRSTPTWRPGLGFDFAWAPAMAMAACAFVAVLGGAMLWRAYGPDDVATQHYETARGGMQTLRLADGSRLELNGDTSLDVRIGSRRRLVTLQRGQAFFDVAHEARRPFEVRTQASRAVVLGTAFDLDVTRGAVALSVYRGRVRFGSLAASAEPVDVDAGRRTVLRDETPSPLERFDATQDDWREGWLDTDGIGLGRLVEELNRRAGPYIVSQSPSIARIRISGRFRLTAPDRLLEALGESYGFHVVRKGDQLLLVANAPAEGVS